jgi:hypothetical protein
VAKKKVVKPLTDFYEAFKPAIQELNLQYGPLYLAMIVRFAEEPEDEWTFLVGSRALARDSAKGTTAVAEELSERVHPQVTRKVRRIGIIRESDPLYSAIVRAIGVRVGGLVEIESCTFDGIRVERGALFASIKRVRKARSGGPRQRG